MKVQSDAEQSIEHLLKAVKSICTADLIVQRAPVKSHQSQGHVGRAVRLVENQYRALLFDAQERTRVEIDPISAASAWILRHSVWLLNRYQPQRRSDINVSQEVHTDLPFFRCSRWRSVRFRQIQNFSCEHCRSMWVGRTEESDEHLVVNEIGHVVRARTVRRCVENESSSTQLVVEVRQR